MARASLFILPGVACSGKGNCGACSERLMRLEMVSEWSNAPIDVWTPQVSMLCWCKKKWVTDVTVINNCFPCKLDTDTIFFWAIYDTFSNGFLFFTKTWLNCELVVKLKYLFSVNFQWKSGTASYVFSLEKNVSIQDCPGLVNFYLSCHELLGMVKNLARRLA